MTPKRDKFADPLGPEDKDFTVTVTTARLLLHLRGKNEISLLGSTDLASVRHIHWEISAFSRVGTVRITLWDKETQFEQSLIDVIPFDSEAQQIGWFRAPDLKKSPYDHDKFIQHFAPRIASGDVTSSIDVLTLLPIAPAAVQTTPGVIYIGGGIIYDPSLAKTERQLRSERDW